MVVALRRVAVPGWGPRYLGRRSGWALFLVPQGVRLLYVSTG